jgi:exopolysaccharide biosynthesis polyprenyl glycosylphosphotransferase
MSSARAGADAPTRPETPSGGPPLGGPIVPPARLPGSEPHDVRRKRPPALAFILRMDTMRRLTRVVSLLGLDLLGLFLAIFTALCIKAWGLGALDDAAVRGALTQTEDLVSFAFLVCALLFARSGLYAGRDERPGLTRIVAGLFQTTVVALLFALVNGLDFQSYYIFYGSLFFAVAYVGLFRYAYEATTGAALKAAGYRRRAVLVGTGEHIDAVAHALSSSGDSRVNVMGFVSLTARPDNGLRSLGSLRDIADIIAEHRVDEVIIADPAFPEQETVELVDVCHQRGVTVRIAPSTMEILVHRAEFVPGQSVPLFELRPPVFEGFDYALKRSFDLVGASLILLVLSPLLIACALAVKLTSRGPVLYRSMRPGIGGVPFACFKFRTMYRDADERQADLESMNEASGALFKIRDDPRMTPVGRVIRRYSIDELPQLFNVLLGQMSLVGPRPLPQRDYERLEDWHKKRYLVLPGITGLWQVSGRADLDFDDLVRLDFLYLERWSVFLDLSILLKTIPAVISRRGAF